MLETGTIVSGYRIDATLGSGGMGAVYVATQLSLNRTVALKVLAAHLSEDATFRERFRREGLIQAALDHPHIVPIHEAGETEHGLFLAMRLIRGRNLKQRIGAGEMTPERVLRVLSPVADALDTAHGAGLIHRDIKPQNILVGGDDHAYLADFGLGRASDQQGLTKTGQLVGTLDYIAPEQVMGKPASPASDIYAFACVLYECLTGVVPFPRDSDGAILYAHVSEPAPVVSVERPGLPSGLNAVIAKSMDKKPGKRHPTAGALMQAVEEVLLKAGPLSAPRAGRGGGSSRTDTHDITDRLAAVQPSQPVVAELQASDGGAEAGSALDGARECPSCARTSGTDGRFCPYCGSEYGAGPTGFQGLGRDHFRHLADPARRPEHSAELQATVRELWEAVEQALPETDRPAIGQVEVDRPGPGADELRSRGERGEGSVRLSLALTPRELQLGLEAWTERQSEAFLSWLAREGSAEQLEELAGYRLTAWVARADDAGQALPAGGRAGGRRRVFDRDASRVDAESLGQLVGLMTEMEAITGMSALWQRPAIWLGTGWSSQETVERQGELPAQIASEFRRLAPLIDEIDRAAAERERRSALAAAA